MERVLVTGANGYIGRKVVDALLALGYKVTATDFKCDQINPKADRVEIDLFNNNANLYELFLKPNRLIHFYYPSILSKSFVNSLFLEFLTICLILLESP